ncbi:ribose transport system permease protein [Natronobacillus azotifigens]|uniref:ABC transporter permease n=1 Tax=Natronobacillus azotifigens TaxID=472978 RepID=A0A9J6RB06_9BACI|nr:hypothetical protein [Natronobacillus azotifigens]MCZ0702507.1 hypothetical protein [Natronobacillus azotifigens]
MKFTYKNHLIKTIHTFLFPIAVYTGILLITFILGESGYASAGAFDRIIRNSVLSTIIAYAIALPLSGGRWDFTPGIIIILSGILGSNIAIQMDMGPIFLLIITVAIAMLLSLIVGAIYLGLRVPTIIVSLGVVMIYEAISGIVFNGSGAQLYMYSDLTIFARAPLVYVILGVVMFFVYYLLTYTKFGYDTRALSINPRLAVNTGIQEKKNIMQTYLVVGILLGVAGVLNASTVLVSPANNLISTALMFSSMGPVLIGLFLARYSNMALGIFAGSLTMNALSYGMVIIGIHPSMQTVVIGVFIVVFMGYAAKKDRNLEGQVA